MKWFDCSHAVALALKAISCYRYRSATEDGLDVYDLLLQRSRAIRPKHNPVNAIAQWSNTLTAYKKVAATPTTPNSEAVVYLLKVLNDNVRPQQAGIMIKLERSKLLKRGGHGKSRELALDSDRARSIMTPEDKIILNHLYAAQDDLRLYKSECRLMLKNCDKLFEALLNSGKAYWESTANAALSLGQTHKLVPRWKMSTTGKQHLSFYTAESNEPIQIHLLPTQPVWYYDASTQQLGKIEATLPAETLLWLSRLPPIPPTQATIAKQQLDQLFPKTEGVPQLQTVARTPHLTIYTA